MGHFDKNIPKFEEIKQQSNFKYLVRPDDYMIFEIDSSNGCYRLYEEKEFKNRPNAYDHFTFERLTKDFKFIPIAEEDIPFYQKKCNEYYAFLSWQNRNDGHGGVKGGTKEEYGEYLKRVEEFQKTKKVSNDLMKEQTQYTPVQNHLDKFGADIRNKLTPFKTLIDLVKEYHVRRSTSTLLKASIWELIEKEIKQCEINIEYLKNLL